MAASAGPRRQLEAAVAGPHVQPTGMVAGPLSAGPPLWLLAILRERSSIPLESLPRDIDIVELCSGQGELHKAFERKGFQAYGIDCDNDPGQDLLQVSGLVAAVHLFFRIKPGGVLWAAPPCASWVWISTSWHQRSAEQPWGDLRKEKVRAANSLACIIGACIRLAVGRGVQVFLEHPESSIYHCAPPIKKALLMAQCQEVVTHLGAFGATISKPLRIWSNCRLLRTLRRNLSQQQRRQNRNRAHPYYQVGCFGAVTGRPALSATAYYPRAFGDAVAASYIRSLPQIQAELAQVASEAGAVTPSWLGLNDPDPDDRSAYEHLHLSA